MSSGHYGTSERNYPECCVNLSNSLRGSAQTDSTGLKLCGAGELLVEKHGTWRKLHLGVDTGTGQIVAAALTRKEVDDAAQIGPLLDQVTSSLASVIADTYDQDGVTSMSPSVTPTRGDRTVALHSSAKQAIGH